MGGDDDGDVNPSMEGKSHIQTILQTVNLVSICETRAEWRRDENWKINLFIDL